MNESKIKFIKGTLLYRAWAASVQKAYLYKKNATDHDKRKFRDQTIAFLEKKIIPKYVKKCPEKNHYNNIDNLIKKANEIGKNVLEKNIYKYGVAQKLLNVALKFLIWSFFRAVCYKEDLIHFWGFHGLREMNSQNERANV